MNQLERACLTSFVADYQKITLQIEQHSAHLKELEEETVRVNSELVLLEREKEFILNQFADAMLHTAQKFDGKRKQGEIPVATSGDR